MTSVSANYYAASFSWPNAFGYVTAVSESALSYAMQTVIDAAGLAQAFVSSGVGPPGELWYPFWSDAPNPQQSTPRIQMRTPQP